MLTVDNKLLGNGLCEMDFAEWLQKELDKRDWKQSNLVHAGVTSSYLSRVMNGLRKPGPRLCRQIAKALNLPEQEVYERAGLLKGLPQGDKEIEEYVRQRLPLISPKRRVALFYFLDHLIEAERIEKQIDRDVSALDDEGET